MLLLTKKAIEKDRSLKTQFLLSSSNSRSSERISEAVWKKNVFVFFSDEKANFNISIKIFLQNTLCYINQGHISTVKGGS